MAALNAGAPSSHALAMRFPLFTESMVRMVAQLGGKLSRREQAGKQAGAERGRKGGMHRSWEARRRNVWRKKEKRLTVLSGICALCGARC